MQWRRMCRINEIHAVREHSFTGRITIAKLNSDFKLVLRKIQLAYRSLP